MFSVVNCTDTHNIYKRLMALVVAPPTQKARARGGSPGPHGPPFEGWEGFGIISTLTKSLGSGWDCPPFRFRVSGTRFPTPQQSQRGGECRGGMPGMFGFLFSAPLVPPWRLLNLSSFFVKFGCPWGSFGSHFGDFGCPGLHLDLKGVQGSKKEPDSGILSDLGIPLGRKGYLKKVENRSRTQKRGPETASKQRLRKRERHAPLRPYILMISIERGCKSLKIQRIKN